MPARRAIPLLLLAAFGIATAPSADPTEARRRQCIQAAADAAPFDSLPEMERPPLPTPIPESKREKEYPAQVALAGNRYPEGHALSAEDRQDGIYIYAVVRHHGQDHLLWSLRALPTDPAHPAQNLATHSALLARAAQELGVPVAELQCVAAGQAQILNGWVSRLDNKAGTRRDGNGPRNLDYAEFVLRSRGLRIPPRTRDLTTIRQDYSTATHIPDFHVEADALAEMRRTIDASPDLSDRRRRLLALHAEIFRDFPELRDPHTPGYLDLDRMFNATTLDAGGEWPIKDFFDRSQYKPVLRWLQIDGVELATMNLRDVPMDRFEQIVRRVLAVHRAARP